ncbi:MAG: quinolinate synthase NadA [Candidatus Cloacimonetes bacterium]|nr:quinolinate synthase NadA [Candidatus Cloacimonadota bacterium]
MYHLDQTEIAGLKEKILSLKRKKNYFIIAHNYVDTEVQEIADYVGDSLQMALKAAESAAEKVLVASIKIMGESAKLLNPDKKVFMAHPYADCRLANLNNVEELKELKRKYPQAEVVCYVNSAIELRAESTVTCTSANCVKIVQAIPEEKQIIFIPDSNIGKWVEYQTGRKLVMLNSNCYVHHQISLDEAKQVKVQYPDFSLLVHPECGLEVCKLADEVLSTSQMIDYASKHDRVILGTETGLYDQLLKRYPQKSLVPLSSRMICEDMKLINLKLVAQALAEEQYEVNLEGKMAEKSLNSLKRMWEILG